MRILLAFSVILGFLSHFTLARPNLKEIWRQKERAISSDTVTFTVALYQRNLQQYEKLFLEISNPKSPNYAEWLSIDEIMDMIAPEPSIPQEVIDHVHGICDGASTNFVTDVKNYRDAVQFTVSVGCVEVLFPGVVMHRFEHSENGHRIIRSQLNGVKPVFPDHIQQHIQLLEGLSQLPIARNGKHRPAESITDPSANVYNYVIPQTARRVYNIPSGLKITNPKTSQSVIEFLPVGAPAFSDMVTFAQQAGEAFTNISHIWGPWRVGNNGESTLDIEYLATIGNGGDTWYITIADGWQYEFAVALFNMPDAPLVNSVSYGWPEEDSCSAITHAHCDNRDIQGYVNRSNVEFQKIGGRGISVIVCSQDEGAPSEANMGCFLDNSHPLWPVYPGSSPWVTSVSGTTLIDQTTEVNDDDPPICKGTYHCAKGTLELPCMTNNTEYRWTTGGGFSKWAAAPDYQKTAIQDFISSSAFRPPEKFFNVSNRGYPDVSALGDRILITQSGFTSVTAGTSASTPIFTALVSLLNDWRLNNNKKPLGFLNPLLYQMAVERPATFKSIVAGDNTCTIGRCCKYGYGANPKPNPTGWDPVTGLGTPNFGEMLEYIKNIK